MVTSRKQHVLTDNRSSQRPQRYIFVDTESKLIKESENRIIHEYLLGWCLYWRIRKDRAKDTLIYYFCPKESDIAEKIDKCTSNKETLYAIAHNWQYDGWAAHIFINLEALGYKLEPPYINQTTFIMKASKGQKKIIFIDNAQFYPGKLENLAKLVSLEKLEVDFNNSSYDDICAYCKRDVEILYELRKLWLNFIDSHNLGSHGLTIPSQAFNAFRHRFMYHKIVIHDNQEAIELERAAYHGGRTSVFRVFNDDKNKYYKLDINSAYPYAMKYTEVPIKLLYVIKNIDVNTLKRYIEKYAVIAKVLINTNEPVYVYNYNNHNIYPIGTFETVLTTQEIEYAIKNNHIVDIIEVCVYEKAIIFDRYVDYFYNLKQKYTRENNVAFRYITKLFLNSLYGKFGQRDRKITLIDETENIFTENGELYNKDNNSVTKIYTLGSTRWMEQTETVSFNAFPAIAAHITASVRLYLWSLINKAGKNHVFYCDTDSLIVDDVGYNNLLDLIDSNKLGYLKLEEVINNINIIAPKVYQVNQEWKRKGIPYDAKKIENNTFEYIEWPSLRTYCSMDPNTPYYNVKRIKTLYNTIYDGRVNENGWIVPYNINDLMERDIQIARLKERIYELQTELKLLKENRIVPFDLMRIVYDFKRDTIKDLSKPRESQHGIKKTGYDSLCTEYGFINTHQLERYVLKQRMQDKQIENLNQRIKTLRDNINRLKNKYNVENKPVEAYDPLPF